MVHSDPMGSDHYPIWIKEVIGGREDRRDHWTQINWKGVGSAMAAFSEHVYEEGFD